MAGIDSQILNLQRRLFALKQKAKQKSSKRTGKILSKLRGRGRPQVDEKEIEKARKLAETKTISDVVLITGISKATLYREGVKRELIPFKK
jgi:DNA invertase Pin-like site-specific DNA recombinase